MAPSRTLCVCACVHDTRVHSARPHPHACHVCMHPCGRTTPPHGQALGQQIAPPRLQHGVCMLPPPAGTALTMTCIAAPAVDRHCEGAFPHQPHTHFQRLLAMHSFTWQGNPFRLCCPCRLGLHAVLPATCCNDLLKHLQRASVGRGSTGRPSLYLGAICQPADIREP
jgi:hypothetical protein